MLQTAPYGSNYGWPVMRQAKLTQHGHQVFVNHKDTIQEMVNKAHNPIS